LPDPSFARLTPPDHIPAIPSYELFAIRCATRDMRLPEHFIGGGLHDTPMSMD
jgi:hypothetical protein